MTNFSYTAHQNNFQLDLLGRPIKVGDRVLTKGYGSAAMDNFATVIAVNRKSVSINVEYRDWYKDDSGNWQRRMSTKPMKRVGYHSVLVVNELEPISAALANDFVQTHPELAI